MADTCELREEAARIIYAAFPHKGEVFPPTKPAWVVNGNSIMQTEARRAAAKILALPGLQAEAPEDARQGVHEVCDKCGLDLRKATTECPSWHGLDLPCDYHRTSQAEAQAPASVLTDVDALARECFKEFAVFQGTPFAFDDMAEDYKSVWRFNAQNIIDRLTGAPAPAPTTWRPLISELREVIEDAKERFNRDGKDGDQISDQVGYIASALLGFISTNLKARQGS